MAIPPRELVNDLLSKGRHDFTFTEAQELLGQRPATASSTLSRLQRRGELFSPARGLYVVVPPEFRAWGAPPAIWFIDPLMRHLRRPYYVSLLSAALLHGASHQSPQVLQVMTDRVDLVRPRQFGRVRIRFHSNREVSAEPVERVPVQTGYAVVATRELATVDLVTHPRVAGGLSNVATVIRQIGELNGSALAQIASRRSRSAVRRTGWLVAHFGEADDLEALRQAARVDLGEATLLSPSGRRRGHVDPDWALRINTTVEPDA